MEKRQLIIVLDESTETQEGDIGPSLCFWAGYVYAPGEDTHITNAKLPEDSRYEAGILMKSANKKPVRSGAIYNDQDTPIKICLDGIARALEACHYIPTKYDVNEIVVCGDCEPALNFAAGKQTISAVAIQSICGQITVLVKKYQDKGVEVSFRYISEHDFSLFKEIDALAKEIRGRMKKISD